MEYHYCLVPCYVVKVIFKEMEWEICQVCMCSHLSYRVRKIRLLAALKVWPSEFNFWNPYSMVGINRSAKAISFHSLCCWCCLFLLIKACQIQTTCASCGWTSSISPSNCMLWRDFWASTTLFPFSYSNSSSLNENRETSARFSRWISQRLFLFYIII